MILNEVLIESLKNGSLLVCPTRRLATALTEEYNQHIGQLTHVRAWSSAKIYSLQDWLQTVWQQAQTAGWVSESLLPAMSALLMLEKIISSSSYGASLLRYHSTAKLVLSAWNILNQWDQVALLEDKFTEYDQVAFKTFCDEYRATLKAKGAIDSAQLLSKLINILKVNAPALEKHYETKDIICFGFDDLTPQVQNLFRTLTELGWNVTEAQPTLIEPQQLHKVACKNIQEEMLLAARWSKQKLAQNPKQKIAIVLPNLPAYRNDILEVFKELFTPLHYLNPEDSVNPLFNVSSAIPLMQYPVIQTALLLLDLLKYKANVPDILGLLQSPYIQGGVKQYETLQEIVSQLRMAVKEKMTIAELIALITKHFGSNITTTDLLLAFQARQLAIAKSKESINWKGEFLAILKLFGWPGERRLNSIEHQAVKRLYQALNDFAQVQVDVPSYQLSDALEQFKKILSNIPFQPENKGAPIQILGILEASGLAFDALWVMNLYHENWPPKAEPNPFIPIDIQRTYNMPHASADRELIFSQTLTQKLCHSAQNIICSYPSQVENNKVYVSELITGLTNSDMSLVELDVPESSHSLHDISAKLNHFSDNIAPKVLNGSQFKGGSQILGYQSNCPFKAFAKFRLDASKPEVQTLGLSPKTRGILVHDILQHVWEELKSQKKLVDLGEGLTPFLQKIIERVIKKHQSQYTLSGHYWEIEQTRLLEIMQSVMEYEKQRPKFNVIAIEDQRQINISGLQINTRMDRVDQVGEHEYLMIDYKTGKKSINDILYTPLKDPQLPLYLQGNYSHPPQALAWFNIEKNEPKMLGLCASSDLNISDITPIQNTRKSVSWSEQLEEWTVVLTGLADDFMQGKADVAPINEAQTCRYCDLMSFCRIAEKT
tara:strand:- start:16361 stop:19024 length:2664 start_codon:yes stop_codon:yes gene_type:complete